MKRFFSIAVLLAALLWTNLAGRPLFSSEATAQVRTKGPSIPTVPNAARQRDEILKALRDIRASVEATRSTVESGGIKVRVTNLNEFNRKE